MSDITVQVLSIHKQFHKQGTSIYKRLQPYTIYAILSDGIQEENVITLNQCEKFHDTLKESMKLKSNVHLTYLLSGHSLTSHASISENDTIALIPTTKTQITIHQNSIQKQNNHFQHNVKKRKQPELSLDEDITESLELSEQSPNYEVSTFQNNCETLKIHARLMDIKWPNLNIFISQKPENLFDALIYSTPLNDEANVDELKNRNENLDHKYSYRDCILTLINCSTIEKLSSSTSSTLSTSSTSKPIYAYANSHIMKTICGSISPCQLAKTQNENSKIEYKNVRALVSDLIYGLIDEKILLEWTIHKSQSSSQKDKCMSYDWEISNVRLINI